MSSIDLAKQISANGVEAATTGAIHVAADKWFWKNKNDLLMVGAISSLSDLASSITATLTVDKVSDNVAGKVSYLTYFPPIGSGIIYSGSQYFIGSDSKSMLNQFLTQVASSVSGKYAAAPIRSTIYGSRSPSSSGGQS